ncbi:MAG: LemA family protein [Steroidobacteraceae bacterium]
MRKLFWLVPVVAVLLLSGCGYNQLVGQDEGIKAAWSEVVNQYQRRADLIPNLVNVVKGYTQYEEKVLKEVTEARSRVGGINVTPELVNDADAFKKFQEAQGALTSALSRLIAVSERYPDLKASAQFQDLQVQLEGTENRIAVARGRYITAVQQYNTTRRKFPNNLTASMFGFKEKANFSVENEAAISKPPIVDFNAPPPAAQPSGN